MTSLNVAGHGVWLRCLMVSHYSGCSDEFYHSLIRLRKTEMERTSGINLKTIARTDRNDINSFIKNFFLENCYRNKICFEQKLIRTSFWRAINHKLLYIWALWGFSLFVTPLNTIIASTKKKLVRLSSTLSFYRICSEKNVCQVYRFSFLISHPLYNRDLTLNKTVFAKSNGIFLTFFDR